MILRHMTQLIALVALLYGCNDNASFLNPGAGDTSSPKSESQPAPAESGTEDGTENEGTDEPVWVNSMYLTCSWQAIETDVNLSFGCTLATGEKSIKLQDEVKEVAWKIIGLNNTLLSEGISKGLENLFVLPRQSFGEIKAELTLLLKADTAITKTLDTVLNGLTGESSLKGCLDSDTPLSDCFSTAKVAIDDKTTEPQSPLPPAGESGLLRVTGVSVNGTTWTGAPVPILAGSGATQLKTVPQTGINQIVITFSKLAILAQNKFQVKGVRVSDYPLSSFTIADNRVTLTIGQDIIDDKIRLRISSSGSDIDGEWTNPADFDAAGSSAFPSGDNKDGGSFDFRFNAMRGDASNATAVNNGTLSSIDSLVIINSINGGAYNRHYDIDSNGVVEQADAQFIIDRLNIGTNLTLPAGEP